MTHSTSVSQTITRYALVGVLASVAFCNGCSLSTEPEIGREYRVTADSRFSPEERHELDKCAEEWRTFSSGAVSISFIEGEGDLALKRQGPSPGGYVRRDRLAWIDAESLYSSGFDSRTGVRATCMNLIGQFFGVPLHDAPGALSRGDVVPYFTEEDRRACESAAVC